LAIVAHSCAYSIHLAAGTVSLLATAWMALRVGRARQYLWFRHTFVLTAEQAAALRGLAISALADRKLEVGELAAGTLSGMLKARLAAPGCKGLAC